MRQGCLSGHFPASENNMTGILGEGFSHCWLLFDEKYEHVTKWKMTSLLWKLWPVFILFERSSLIKQTLPLQPFALS